MNTQEQAHKLKSISRADFDFVKHTPLFDAIPQKARLQLFLCITRRQVPAGTRFIFQGEEGEVFYIVRSGSCTVSVERDGKVHPVAIIGPGHTVGEMALLTGERRNAHVESRTEMELWCISRDDFDRICGEYPQVAHFLTGIVTNRLDHTRVTADRTIGKYTINGVLGKGGGSIVYKGVHTSLNMPVAIKMLKHQLAMDPHFLEQFHREARTIANLNHENIVKVYDIEELYRTVFIVMEYLEGKTVESILNDVERLPPSFALNIILQVSAGLGYAHRMGIIHRDVKPANIVVLSGGRVKILDFGLAEAPGATEGRVIEGTPLYVPPERLKPGTVDERSDIYSLGMSCYKMITGRYAFDDADVGHLLYRHLNEDIPDPREFLCDLPDELFTFLTRSTRKNPADRYQSADEIIQELTPLAKKLGVRMQGEGGSETSLTMLSISYQARHGEIVRRLLRDFGKELASIGAVLSEAEYKEVKGD
ncbi:MAG: protein kinase [Pseudomonadota bacterium]